MYAVLLTTVTAVLLVACSTSSIDGLGASPSIGQTSALTTGSTTAAKPGDNVRDSSTHELAKKSADRLIARAKSGAGAYRLGSRDVVQVTVFKVPELSKNYQVSEAGTISFPLIGELEASGRTAREVEKSLTAKWGKSYLQNPQVSVRVSEMNSQRFTIEGAIRKPGVFPISGDMTLLQAIATSGGLQDTAESTVVLFREQGQKRKAARFDIAEIRAGRIQDPKLQAGDVIIAKTSGFHSALQNILKVLPLASFVLI